MQIKTLLIVSLILLPLLSGWASADAESCENLWGGSQSSSDLSSETLKPEHVRLCLPLRFIPEPREDGVVFRDPSDTNGSRGRIGLAIATDSKYAYSDVMEEYERLKITLCQLSNVTAGTLCSVTKIQGKLYVALKGLQVGVYSEAFIHVGKGYMLALTAEAPDSAAYLVLRTVLQSAVIP